jgi:hypothetical protein
VLVVLDVTARVVITVELGELVEAVARIVAELRQPRGQDEYAREPEPDPGPRNGARHGTVDPATGRVDPPEVTDALGGWV